MNYNIGDIVKFLGETKLYCLKCKEAPMLCPRSVDIGDCEHCKNAVNLKKNNKYKIVDILSQKKPDHGTGCICKRCTEEDMVVFDNGKSIAFSQVKLISKTNETIIKENKHSSDNDDLDEGKNNIIMSQKMLIEHIDGLTQQIKSLKEEKKKSQAQLKKIK